MKSYTRNKMFFAVFVVLMLGAIGYGVYYVLNGITAETYEFSKDGYALFTDAKNDLTTQSLSFSGGTKYNYKKLNDKISFESKEGNVNIDESTVIHYADNSLLVLKNVVGLDTSTVDSKIIFYYNIYKNTEIEYEDGKYVITVNNKEKITFNNLLLRINENKYLYLGENIRATISEEEVIDFGNYVYFEYGDGQIINFYNDSKKYKTISKNISLICDKNVVNLSDKSISKGDKKYITITNLVIDNDSNIDLIIEEDKKLPTINLPDDNSNVGGDQGGNSGGGNNVIEDEEQQIVEEEVDTSTTTKQATYKVTEMVLSPISIDAKIEIEDPDSVITSPTKVQIVENSTAKVITETEAEAGDTFIYVSYSNLKPDTEYTLYAKAEYAIEGVDYSKSFISKIFRTEALGVSFEKSYSTVNSISVEIDRETYSKVTSLTISIYDKSKKRIDYETVEIANKDEVEITFDELEPNKEYEIVMHEILCQGVAVREGYSETKIFKTLKQAPSVGKLNYELDKRNSTFNMSASNIQDPDYGIVGYRYEIYDIRMNLETADPILSITETDLDIAKAKVDGVKLERNVDYTYKFVVIFNDNEKIVEYTKDSNQLMQLVGTTFPSVSFEQIENPDEVEDFDKTKHDRIVGTLIIEDEGGVLADTTKFFITYKNSVGTYTSLEKQVNTETQIGDGEFAIPINVYNLKQEETYTFQVYAEHADLHDGNGVIDSLYLGSFYVTTPKSNPLQANYTFNTDYNRAFAISFSLTDPNGVSAAYEASTLNELTFTLYQGSSVSGKKEISKRVLDMKTGVNEEYISTIAEDFYNVTKVIDPTFFDGAKNTDFQQKTYTLEISGAYDYTDVRNEIEILNNSYVFNLNTYVPDIPSDPDNAIFVSEIENKSAASFGLEHDPDLDPNAIVGYNLLSNYYSEAGNAEKLIYYTWVYDHANEKYVEVEALRTEVDFDENGQIPMVTLPVGYGTPNDTLDLDMLRRGNTYYFTYEVMLDMDGDGQAESRYPDIIDENIVLRCPELKPEKITSQFMMYPSTSNAETATWKYTYSDYDHALYGGKLFSTVGNAAKVTSSAPVIITDTYRSAEFTGLTKGDFYSIKKQEKLTKSSGTPSLYTTISTQYFYGTGNAPRLTYTSKIENNNLVIEIDDFEENEEKVEKLASATVYITPTNTDDLANLKQTKLTDLTFEGGSIQIPLFDIAKYLNTEVKVTVHAYYDTGITGFDTEEGKFYALQEGSITDGASYYVISSQNNLVLQPNVLGSEYNAEFNLTFNTITLTNRGGQRSNVPIKVSKNGVRYMNSLIIMKKLDVVTLTANNTTVKFNNIIPSVNLQTEKNENNIVSLLNSAKIYPEIKVAPGTTIRDNIIYIELCQTNENGVIVDQGTCSLREATVDELNAGYEIEGLLAKTDYGFKLYTYVLDNTLEEPQYLKYYLYDDYQSRMGVLYTFNTLSDVGIGNITGNLATNAYNDKKVNITYTLQNIQGYDRIDYKIYELIDDKYVLKDIEIPSETFFKKQMTLQLDANPNNEFGFSFGKTYKIEIIPMSHYVYEGETVEIDLGSKSGEFTLKNYEIPQIGITPSKRKVDGVDTIVFRVNISDNSKVSYNDVYTVKLTDIYGNEIAVLNENDIKTANQVFMFDEINYPGLVQGHTYKFEVSILADYLNNGNPDTFTRIALDKEIIYGDVADIGSVSINKNKLKDTAVDLSFANTYKFNTVDRIDFTVTSPTTAYFFSRTNVEFNKVYDEISQIYTYTIELEENEFLAYGNVYTFNINFYAGDLMVGQAEVNYHYIETVEEEE